MPLLGFRLNILCLRNSFFKLQNTMLGCVCSLLSFRQGSLKDRNIPGVELGLYLTLNVS